MPYADEMVRSGSLLFRWRSYVPLALLALLLVAMRRFAYIGDDHRLDLLWEALCLTVSFVGLGIRAHVIGHAPAGTSGRNTHGQVADTLNTTGLYSLVRHPLYVGNLLMWLGIAMFLHDWRIVLVTVTFYWLYYERIVLAEEAYLRTRFGASFEQWASRTPAFVPRAGDYVRPGLPFSLRQVLRREYSGMFAVVAIMFALEVLGDFYVHRAVVIEPLWLGLFAASATAYLILRTLKKRTRILLVEGR